MQCTSCGKDLYSWKYIGTDPYCYPCHYEFQLCYVCNGQVENRKLIINKSVCNSCFSKIVENARNDPRIQKLLVVKLPELKAETTNTQDDFDAIEDEALTAALKLKNYKIIGVSPNDTLNVVRDKCKELMIAWHPDLHKHDQEKYKQAVEKVSEIKKAYEAIFVEKRSHICCWN